MVLGSIASADDMWTGAHKNTLAIHSPLCISFLNILRFSLSWWPCSLELSGSNEPKHPSYRHRNSETKRKDEAFQFKTAPCVSLSAVWKSERIKSKHLLQTNVKWTPSSIWHVLKSTFGTESLCQSSAQQMISSVKISNAVENTESKAGPINTIY